MSSLNVSTLNAFYYPSPESGEDVKYEICLDECGRGPLFGRVYAAAVVLPRDSSKFDYHLMKDSKKIHSKKKMGELAEYVRKHAVCTSVTYAEADVIDRENILQADMRCMHECVRDVMRQMPFREDNITPVTWRDFVLLVDGNYFKPVGIYDDDLQQLQFLPHITVEKGDSLYAGIAAASILAKHDRDTYIGELCQEYPELSTRYALDRNMGYGTKAHLEGITKYGITAWHRKTFGICKKYSGLS